METETKFKINYKVISIMLLLVVLTALSVGGGLYYVLNQNFQKERETNEKALNDIRNQLNEKVTKPSTTPTPTPISEVEIKNYQYVLGTQFELDKSIGTLLQWNLKNDRVNISSTSLLDKEKELFGDATLYCQANGWPLGTIDVKDESTAYGGAQFIKKLDSGKYLYYTYPSKVMSCYEKRAELRTMIDSQSQAIFEALKNAK